MTASLTDTLTGRIREAFDGLPGTQRALASAILDLPGDVASYSATELAELAGVSKMTVTRLVRRLGFNSYDEARVASRPAHHSGSPFHELTAPPPNDAGGGAGGEGGSTPTVERHLSQCAENIAATAQAIDPDTVTRIAAALAGASRVWVVGFRNSLNLAGYARWQFTQIRPNIVSNVQTLETLAETLTDIDAEDVVVVIGTRRRPAIFPRFLDALAGRGARVVFIGDAHSAIGTDLPAFSLLCRTRSLIPLDNHAAVIAVIHAVAAEMFRQIMPEARTRLRIVAGYQEDLGEI